MTIEFVRAWRRCRRGQLISTFTDGVSNLLIRRGIARLVEAEPAPAPASNTKKRGKRK